MTDQRPDKEVYSQRDNPAYEVWMTTRTAAQQAAFFLPHLLPGMQLLDVGCGPGTITVGLAKEVAPGDVVGTDLQPTQVEQARAVAAERGIANVRFEVGDAYRLPFPDRSFDAVFAHAVLMHLREPVRALAEMWRVLRPGGIVGVRDPDLGGEIFTPATLLQEERHALGRRVGQHMPCAWATNGITDTIPIAMIIASKTVRISLTSLPFGASLTLCPAPVLPPDIPTQRMLGHVFAEGQSGMPRMEILFLKVKCGKVEMSDVHD